MLNKIFFLTIVLSLLIQKCFSLEGHGRAQVAHVYKTLYKAHTTPPELSPAFSEAVYDKLIESLDPDQLHFTSESLKKIVGYRSSLDKEITGVSWTFFNTLLSTYKSQLKETDSLISIIMSRPLDLQKGQSITLPPALKFHPADYNDKKKYLTYYFKIRMMRSAFFENPNDSLSDPFSDKTFEKRIREEIREADRKELSDLLNNSEELEKFVLHKFCNAIALTFDPHCEFMPPAAQKKFIQDVSAEQYTFGLELEINANDEFEISGLLPGGPAWETGEIQKGDVVLEIKYGNKKTVDLKSSDIYDVYTILDNIDKEDLNITVKKTDGKVVTVNLNKELIADEESTVKSFILNGKKKIGFIVLPGFYSDFGHDGGNTCANDVAKEIWKLKKDSIEALIIDMRYNGGGSVLEAVDMSGIFINEGVVCFQKKGNEKAIALKDPNRGTSYDGPLLLLVNGQSASATELLSGTLQDYNRAIIVGGQTYGKATAQVVIPADSGAVEKSLLGMKSSDEPKNGYVKVTIGKVYLPTGRTIQGYGVLPDILLPDLFDSLNIREKDQPHFLPADSVKKAVYFSPLDKLPLQELANKSRSRVENNKSFTKNRKISAYYRKINDESRSVPLDWTPYTKLKRSDTAFLSSLNESNESDSLSAFSPENTDFDKSRVTLNEERKESNEEWLESLSTDIYINESYLILEDYLNLLYPETHK